MLRTIAMLFGIVMIGIGVLGFFPSMAPGGYLFGVFHINVVHNIIHIGTGVVAILCGGHSFNASQIFFRVFGIVYAVVALLGFYFGDQAIFGLIANNWPDNFLHLAIAAGALFLGFVYSRD